MKKSLISLVLICTLIMTVMITPACTPTRGAPDPAVQGLAERFGSTVTALAAKPNTSSEELAAAIQKATTTADAVWRSRTAAAEVVPTQNLATQAALEPILAELPLYGIDPQRQGHAAWIHPPVTVDVEGYHQTAYKNDFSLITARDFVMAADITWDTTNAASGCGFVLRSNGDTEKPSAYMVALSRGRTGYFYFVAQQDGKPANYASIFANGKDPKFNWQKNSTNRLVVVAKGKELSIYSNYTLIGVIDVTATPQQPHLPDPPPMPPRPDINPLDQDYSKIMDRYQEEMRQYQADMDEYKQTVTSINKAYNQVLNSYDPKVVIESGFMGLLAFDESGKTTCHFDKAWLWILDE